MTLLCSNSDKSALFCVTTLDENPLLRVGRLLSFYVSLAKSTQRGRKAVITAQRGRRREPARSDVS